MFPKFESVPPKGTRTDEFTVNFPGTNAVFTNTPCRDPLDESKDLLKTHLGLGPVIGDPNITVAEKPHGDVIANRLRAVVASADSSPEERQEAESLRSLLYGKPNLPHHDVINGPNIVPEEPQEGNAFILSEFDEQPKPTRRWEPSDGTPGKTAEPQPVKPFEPLYLEIGNGSMKVIFNNPGRKA
jgi:hypothetical protein